MHAQYPNQTFIQVQREPRNQLGLVGFVLSLVGILGTCGLLCPLGALISFLALFKRPRTLAFLGLLIGLAGSLGFIFWGFAALVAVLGLGTAAVALESGPRLDTLQTLSRAQSALTTHYRKHNDTLPNANEWRSVLSRAGVSTVDGWNRPYDYSIEGDNKFVLISAGPDGTFHTEDDITPEWSIRYDAPLPEPPKYEDVVNSDSGADSPEATPSPESTRIPGASGSDE
jgi:hypothetical protein